MKILFFGLGSIGKRHVQVLQKIRPDIQLLAFKSLDRNSEFQGELDGIKVFYDIDKAYDEKPAAVFITNPTSMHVDTALMAAKHGCHIFMEKPLSNCFDKTDELLSICKQKELITLMGCNLRFNPVLIKTKELLDNGSLGKPLSFDINCGSYLPDWRPAQDYRDSYSSKINTGGGVVLDLIHEIDYAYWLFGDFSGYKAFIGKVSNLDIETEDFAEIIINTVQGLRGHIHLDYFRKAARRTFEIVCEYGIITGDMIKSVISIDRGQAQELIEFNFERNYMYEKQLEYLLKCIENHHSSFNDIEKGYKVLKYALDIKNTGMMV